MLMMRLQRVGRRNEAHFKIVVIEKTKGPKSHRYVDILGSYNPKMGTVTLDEAAAKDWLSKGVQPSDTVFNMLVTKGLIEGRKKNVLPKKSPTKKRNAPDEEPEVKAPVSKPKADVAKEAPVVEDTTEEAPVEEASVIEEVTETEEAPAAEETPVEEKIEA
ncbi:MAG: small subunit ribosomal protein S16 [Candidatus Paceibacteria bacterium]|jgi:small subunit ribosomal protein S16